MKQVKINEEIIQLSIFADGPSSDQKIVQSLDNREKPKAFAQFTREFYK